MRRRLLAALAGLVVAGAYAAALATGVVHVDFYPSLATYGVSAGTDSAYCSADLVGWVPAVSCERAS